MRLIARDAAVGVRPISPLRGEILKQQFSKRLSVVADDAPLTVCAQRILRVQQICERFEVISSSLLKLLIEFRCPVSTIHLIGVIEHGIWESHALIGKSSVEAFEISRHRPTVEVVNDKTFASRSSPLHLLLRAPYAMVILLIENQFASSILLTHERPSERPSCASSHIHFHAELLAPRLNISQHAHPLRREISYLISLIIHHAIDRSYLHTANAGLGILCHAVVYASRVDSTSVPPPSCVGFSLTSSLRPLLSRGLCRRTERKRNQSECTHNSAIHKS